MFRDVDSCFELLKVFYEFLVKGGFFKMRFTLGSVVFKLFFLAKHIRTNQKETPDYEARLEALWKFVYRDSERLFGQERNVFARPKLESASVR